MNKHGFCCSYDEVKRYERCASVAEYDPPQNDLPQSFVQYVADNVDHNITTLDGKNTLHGMGIIGAFTPEIKTQTTIRRTNATADDIASLGRINIHSFEPNTDILSSIRYERLHPYPVAYSHLIVDFLWKISPALSVHRPLWSGFLQLVHRGEHPQPSSVLFPLLIDLDPSDPTCIYSTLKFVSGLTKKHNCTPVITFDQPLWWKANMIVESQPETSELHSIVVRLGGFNQK